MADAVAGLGGLDILVNNAVHQVYHQTFDELEEDDLDRTIKTNLYAMNCTKDALPHLGPGSTIINSTSVQGYNPSPMIINYASTKFAIIGFFTKALAQHLAPRCIRFNAVAPGQRLRR